jgi:predicted RNase H-like nuclease
VVAACGVPAIVAALDRFPSAVAVGIDMPFAFPARGRRAADAAAKNFLGPRAGSVFLMPPEAVLAALSHAEAIGLARSLGELAPSAQGFALFPKIREAREVVASRRTHLYEVHPEVSFRALGGGAVLPRKRSWNGQRARARLLEGAGIHLGDCEGDDIPADDLLDAAIAAWSAARIASGTALTLPAEPTAEERDTNMLVWY